MDDPVGPGRSRCQLPRELHFQRVALNLHKGTRPMEPDVMWIAVSPGVLELPTTKFRITYLREHGAYHLTWDGGGAMSYGDLQSAKEGAARRTADLIEMGIEV
jgi:hypothetical protein